MALSNSGLGIGMLIGMLSSRGRGGRNYNGKGTERVQRYENEKPCIAKLEEVGRLKTLDPGPDGESLYNSSVP